jgi:hypothetical protein
MVLTLDNLAHRYNCLPSEALERASTFDLYVLDTSARYSKYQQDLAEQKANPNSAKLTPKLSQEQMKSMIDRVRGAKNEN